MYTNEVTGKREASSFGHSNTNLNHCQKLANNSKRKGALRGIVIVRIDLLKFKILVVLRVQCTPCRRGLWNRCSLLEKIIEAGSS